MRQATFIYSLRSWVTDRARYIRKNCSLPILLTPILVISMTFSPACLSGEKINRIVGAYLKDIERGATSNSLDMRSNIPAEWMRVCIGYFPYASKVSIERKLQGKVRGEYVVTGDDKWMFLGMNAAGEINQSVFDAEASKLLGKYYRSSREVDCVDRELAVLTPKKKDGMVEISLGIR